MSVPFLSRRRRAAASTVAGLIALVAGLVLLAGGCSDTERPAASGEETQGAAVVAGSLQPGGQTFVLKTLDETLPGRAPIRVDLIGSNLQVDRAAETVSLDVAIRNAGQHPLYASALVWISNLVPPGVEVLNADIAPVPVAKSDSLAARWGFDYTQLLGGDEVLSPGETSEVSTWRFHVPGLTAFSFRASAEFGMVPDLPCIAGRCFNDRNRNGQLDDGEPSVPGGMVTITAPDGVVVVAHPGEDGAYAVPVTQPGLYNLLYNPLVRCRCEVAFTTPNPVQALLPPGANGLPESFLDADFGVFIGAGEDSIPPVLLSPVPLDSLRSDFYHYGEGRVRGDNLLLTVGFSGCGPDHPFTLYWAPGPEASPLLRSADLVLVHDDRGEMCDAAWQRSLAFDLRPMRPGGVVGPITLRLHDFQGVVHTFIWGIWPPD
jgi:hypothetical protein